MAIVSGLLGLASSFVLVFIIVYTVNAPDPLPPFFYVSPLAVGVAGVVVGVIALYRTAKRQLALGWVASFGTVSSFIVVLLWVLILLLLGGVL
jgi:hypothetical protein